MKGGIWGKLATNPPRDELTVVPPEKRPTIPDSKVFLQGGRVGGKETKATKNAQGHKEEP